MRENIKCLLCNVKVPIPYSNTQQQITDLKAEINHWKGKAINLESEETRLEKENKKICTEMANAKNESFELRRRIEKEQNERDKEMERIRTAIPFQVIIIRSG
jgi:predicted  nucleic acid-binding Zn-ribbon protein